MLIVVIPAISIIYCVWRERLHTSLMLQPPTSYLQALSLNAAPSPFEPYSDQASTESPKPKFTARNATRMT